MNTFRKTGSEPDGAISDKVSSSVPLNKMEMKARKLFAVCVLHLLLLLGNTPNSREKVCAQERIFKPTDSVRSKPVNLV